jgi:hypothetical protein
VVVGFTGGSAAPLRRVCDKEPSLPRRILRDAERGGRGKGAAARLVVGLTDQTLSCAAKALVTTAERHAACLHLKCAMQTA